MVMEGVVVREEEEDAEDAAAVSFLGMSSSPVAVVFLLRILVDVSFSRCFSFSLSLDIEEGSGGMNRECRGFLLASASSSTAEDDDAMANFGVLLRQISGARQSS